MHDEWFVDEARVRTAVGLPEKQNEMPNEREVRLTIYLFLLCCPSIFPPLDNIVFF